MNTKCQKLRSHITIPDSELGFMAADAATWVGTETGGALFGLWSHAGRPVVMLATPSGPGATNEAAHFAQDPDHLADMSRFLKRQFGIQLLGNWHSHHQLGLDHPSMGDVEQIHKVAIKSNYSRMVQIVVTYQQSLSSGFRSSWSKRFETIRSLMITSSPSMLDKACVAKERPHPDSPIVRINSFLYSNATTGPYERCPVNVLPECSPIRKALSGSDILRTARPHHSGGFDSEKIIYERIDGAGESVDMADIILEYVASQIDDLPDGVAEQAEVYAQEGVVLLSIPLGDGNSMAVAYKSEGLECTVDSVCIVRGKTRESVDITGETMAGDMCPSLTTVLARARATAACTWPERLADRATYDVPPICIGRRRETESHTHKRGAIQYRPKKHREP